MVPRDSGGVGYWSLNLAKAAYRMPGSQALIAPGTSLDSDYCRAALPVIQQQLAKAAIRTAWLLNQIFARPQPAVSRQ